VLRRSVVAFLVCVCACASADAEDPSPCAPDAEGAVPGQKLCDGVTCTAGPACASGECRDGRCAPDAKKTCGVGLPTACADGASCQQDRDCAGDYCAARVCKPPPADVHMDGRRNGGESGRDCGGPAPPCAGGERCKTNDDCQSTCNDGRCAAPSATDGKKNQGETDVDCGGPNAPPCKRGKTCIANADCQLEACANGTCGEPSKTDGVVNGSETDTDCGGAGVREDEFTYKADPCKEGKTCAADTDCTTAACAPGAKRCTLPSCATAETAGITTCGALETGDADARHESCCRSLQLPSRTTRRLDKYEITSGRYRTFITKVGPNIRGWVAAYVRAEPRSQLARLVALQPSLGDIYPAADRNTRLSLTAFLSLDLDNYDGVRGCYNGAGSYSANTYWQDEDHLRDFGLPARSLPREVSDEKPLNCQMPMMLAAFCAWDGGELATFADYVDAWDSTPNQKYPWGPTDIRRPNYNWCNGPFRNGGFECQCDPVANPGANCSFQVNGYEYGVFYEWPRGTNRALDNEPLIAAPGRFPMDASARKRDGESWMDLYANLAEMTGDFAASTDDFCDLSSGAAEPGGEACTRRDPGPPETRVPGQRYRNIPSSRILGAAWEGHEYPRTGTSTLPVTFQYGKFGGRCARPIE